MFPFKLQLAYEDALLCSIVNFPKCLFFVGQHADMAGDIRSNCMKLLAPRLFIYEISYSILLSTANSNGLSLDFPKQCKVSSVTL